MATVVKMVAGMDTVTDTDMDTDTIVLVQALIVMLLMLMRMLLIVLMPIMEMHILPTQWADWVTAIHLGRDQLQLGSPVWKMKVSSVQSKNESLVGGTRARHSFKNDLMCLGT